MVEAYWEIGRQIEQAVGDRAEYGKGLLQDISKKLSVEFGKGNLTLGITVAVILYLSRRG